MSKWKIISTTGDGRYFRIEKDDERDRVRWKVFGTDSSLSIYTIPSYADGRELVVCAIDDVDKVEGGGDALMRALVNDGRHLEEWRYGFDIGIRLRLAPKIMMQIERATDASPDAE